MKSPPRVLSSLGEGDRLLDVPAARDPVRAGDAYADRDPAGTAALTASNTASGKRMRFSSEPPNSSSRRLESGDRNWCSR